MWHARLTAAALGAVATFCAGQTCLAADQLKLAVGGRGVGETFVTEIGYKAGIFKKHNLELDLFYTDGGGETQQAVIAGSAQIGIASGFLGAIGVFAKGAPVRIIGGSYTGGAQVFWFVRADSPAKTPQDLEGKTIGYSTNGSSTHAGILALQKHYKVNFKPVQTGNAAATMTAVMSGQVDAGWAGAPFGVAELEAGKTRLIMKSGDAPDFDKQTSPRDHRQCQRAEGAAGRDHALHARLSRLAELGLFDAGGSQGLCGLCRLVRGDGAARVAGIPAVERDQSRPHIRDRRGDGRCDRLQIHHGSAHQGAARGIDSDSRTAAVSIAASMARDDLALVAMHDRRDRHHAGNAPQR